MSRKILGMAVAAFLSAVAWPPAPVRAHVFFTDKSGQHGVIMHVTPDDDPVAGDQSEFYFDIKSDKISADTHTFRLQIIDAEGEQSSAATYPAGERKAAAAYTFPVQGVYTVELTATPNYAVFQGREQPVVFSYPQRVSRGLSASLLDAPRYAWAEFGVIASAAMLAVTLIIVAVRRKAILGYTKWK